MSDISSPSSATGKYKILVADDNALNRLLLRKLLLKAGHEVDFAENGAIALQMLHAGRYDILILDIQMPVMDGYETACEIRADSREELRGMPILALTATILQDELNRISTCGINDILTQPFTSDQLLEKISALMRIGI